MTNHNFWATELSKDRLLLHEKFRYSKRESSHI